MYIRRINKTDINYIFYYSLENLSGNLKVFYFKQAILLQQNVYIIQ